MLGGGRNLGSPEYGGETVNDYTLRRARYGAQLARETGLPLYVSGGKPTGGQLGEGTLMRELIGREFNQPVKWVDATSTTTREQAQIAAQDLKPLRSVASSSSPTQCICRALNAPSSWPAWRLFLLRPVQRAAPVCPVSIDPWPNRAARIHIALREWVSQLHYHILGTGRLMKTKPWLTLEDAQRMAAAAEAEAQKPSMGRRDCDLRRWRPPGFAAPARRRRTDLVGDCTGKGARRGARQT